MKHTPIRFDHRRKEITDFLGDVRDSTAVSEAVAVSDGVIHLAGVLGTAETIGNPSPAVETNIKGSLNVFDACKQYKKRCVYISVGNHFMHNSYAITKTTAERFAYMYNKEHGTKIAVVRGLNAYGPGQKAYPVKKIMPNLILPALRNETITIYGDGEQVMDMIWVHDLADILVAALVQEHGVYDRAFEAGTGRPTTVNQIAAMVLDCVGSGEVKHVAMRRGEPLGSCVLGDPTTLGPLRNSPFGTFKHCFTPLEFGIEETVKWYRAQMSA